MVDMIADTKRLLDDVGDAGTGLKTLAKVTGRVFRKHAKNISLYRSPYGGFSMESSFKQIFLKLS
jgi:hypothetical protein